MCAPSQGAMLPYGLKVPSPYFPFGPNGGLTQVHLSALDFQRSQMNDYNVRVQLGLRNYQNAVGLSSFHAYFNDPYTQAYFYKHDPRSRFVQEEPKPSHSYIGLIGMAILNSKDKKLVLSDIYQWILDNYPYFRTRGPGWRNSIRHNLSLNDCFIKAGRSANGKGHYWAVHPANVEDFERGDFRRRRAQRKVRRHMGLSVPDDDDSPTPSPTQSWPHHDLTQGPDVNHTDSTAISNDQTLRPISTRSEPDHMVISHSNPTYGPVPGHPRKPSRKRLFDMASLLAPDDEEDNKNVVEERHIERLQSQQMHVSGFMFHPIQEQKSHIMSVEQSNDKSTDTIESSSTHDLTSNVNRRSSNTDKDINFLSDDDQENDEIQVTSDEESAPQDHDDSFYTSSVFSSENKYENDMNSFNRTSVDASNHKQLTTSSPHNMKPREDNAELRDDNALDLSSPIYFGNEKKLNESSNTLDVNNSFDGKVLGHSPRSKDDCVRILQHTGQIDDIPIKKETGCDKCNGYGETLNDPCTISTSKANCSGCEQIRQIDSDIMMSKLSYRDRCKPQGEKICSIINGGLDHVRNSADKLHYYCSELQDSRRPHNLGRVDSNFESMDNGLLESDRRSDVDTRTLSSESSLSVSDATRGSSDQMRWTDMSKIVLSRDRLSAFSTLGIRNHCLYSPFQLRNFPPTPQRHLAASTPMRTGIQDPLLSVSASSATASITMLNDMDSSASKIRHISNNINNNINSSKNTNNVANNRD